MVVSRAPGQDAPEMPRPSGWYEGLGPGADEGCGGQDMAGLLDGFVGETGPDIPGEIFTQGLLLLGEGLIEEDVHGVSLAVLSRSDNLQYAGSRPLKLSCRNAVTYSGWLKDSCYNYQRSLL